MSQRDPFSQGLLVVVDHVLDVLSRVDSEVLFPTPTQRRHILGVLRVSLQLLGDAIPFDEPLHRYVASVESFDRSLKDSEHRVRLPCGIEPIETVLAYCSRC